MIFTALSFLQLTFYEEEMSVRLYESHCKCQEKLASSVWNVLLTHFIYTVPSAIDLYSNWYSYESLNDQFIMRFP